MWIYSLTSYNFSSFPDLYVFVVFFGKFLKCIFQNGYLKKNNIFVFISRSYALYFLFFCIYLVIHFINEICSITSWKMKRYEPFFQIFHFGTSNELLFVCAFVGLPVVDFILSHYQEKYIFITFKNQNQNPKTNKSKSQKTKMVLDWSSWIWDIFWGSLSLPQSNKTLSPSHPKRPDFENTLN